MNPNYADIVYFLEVARTCNLSRAAERLGITQPSLSVAMRRLEEVLDTPLLIRGKTGVQLTRAGDELANRGRHLLLQWEQIRSEIRKRETTLSGQYVIGCHPSVALYTLSNALPDLILRHPELEIRLVHDLSRKVVEQVVRFEVDFGLVINPVRHPDLVILPLCEDEVRFWAAQPPSTTQVLDPETGVLVCDPELLQARSMLGELEKRQLGFRRVISSGNLEVVADLTAAGVGVGILPRRVATRRGMPELRPLDGSLPVYRDTLCLVYRADAQKTSGARMLIEAIRRSVNPA